MIDKNINNLQEKGISASGKIVSISGTTISGYPRLALRERDVKIKAPYIFSTLTYVRPIGNSKMASADVELYSPSGDIITEKIYFEFKYSENERIEDAKLPQSFDLRPEVVFSRKNKNFAPEDFINKYEDVVITKVQNLNNNEDGIAQVKLSFHFSNSSNRIENAITHTVIVPLYSLESETPKVESLNETLQINILKERDAKNNYGNASSIIDLEHFEVNPLFLRGNPPVVIDSTIIIPRPYIEVMKIDYIPPKDIDTFEAQLIVEYEYNGRTHAERVVIRFATTIRMAAEKVLMHESQVLFKYLSSNRKTPPVYIDKHDFVYTGNLPIKIVGVDYNHNSIDPDNRYITPHLLVQYRTAIVKVPKRIEYQYSKNEYMNGKWVHARTENDSISFKPEFIHPDYIYPKIDPELGVCTKINEILKNAAVVEGYPYEQINELRLINFDSSSRTIMFKVVVTEVYGRRDGNIIKNKKMFEKHIKMPWSYDEWWLGKMTEKHLIINQEFMTDYPTKSISENIFQKSKKYKVISLQYIYPGDSENVVSLQVQVSTGERTKFITKNIEFPWSFDKYNEMIAKKNAIDALRMLQPKDVTLLIDLASRPPMTITPAQVVGIPLGSVARVHYKPPKSGKNATRVIIEFFVGNTPIVGFEQTLIFKYAY